MKKKENPEKTISMKDIESGLEEVPHGFLKSGAESFHDLMWKTNIWNKYVRTNIFKNNKKVNYKIESDPRPVQIQEVKEGTDDYKRLHSAKTIVIGSGPSGLACAGILSKCKEKNIKGPQGGNVVILEHHPYQLGGASHEFPRPVPQWYDPPVKQTNQFVAGVHYSGAMAPDEMFGLVSDFVSDYEAEWTRQSNFVLLAQYIEGINSKERNPTSGTYDFPSSYAGLGDYMKNMFEAAKLSPCELKKMKEACENFLSACSSLNITKNGAWPKLKILPNKLGELIFEKIPEFWHHKILRDHSYTYHDWARMTTVEAMNIIFGATKEDTMSCEARYQYEIILKSLGSHIGCCVGQWYNKLPFFLFAIAIDTMLNGLYLCTGGAGTVGKKVQRTVMANDGGCFSNATVTEIIPKGQGEEKDKVGVRIAGYDEVVWGDRVISCCGLKNTYKLLEKAGSVLKEGSSAKQRFESRKSFIDKHPDSMGFCFLFIQLNDKAHDILEPMYFPAGSRAKEGQYMMCAAKTWIQNDFESYCDKYLNSEKFDLSLLPYATIHVEVTRGMWPGAYVMFPAYLRWFVECDEQGKPIKKDGEFVRRKDYLDLKGQFEERFIKQFLDFYGEGLSDCIIGETNPEYKGRWNSGTPSTMVIELGRASGEAYGLQFDVSRLDDFSNYSQSTVFKDVFISGQDIFSPGFDGALASGILTCSFVLERNLFLDAEKACEQVKKDSECHSKCKFCKDPNPCEKK